VETILSKSAPAPVGPYSQAIRHAGIVYLSGQIPLDPASGKLVGDDIEAQTERVLENLRAVLTEAGSSFSRLLRVSVFLIDMREFPRFNAVYARVLGEARPARSTVQVAALPLGARIEIDAIAAVV
jgi:2-iminobutanoate/2-iminopropanoate deaminase